MAEGQATTIKRVHIGQLFLHSVLVVFVLDFLYFFVWWYTAGLIEFFNFIRAGFQFALRLFPLGILLKNLFKPMFGDYTWQGHLIGFFLRTLQLLGICVILILWCVAGIGFTLLWLLILPLTLWSLVYLLHLTNTSPTAIL